MRKIPILAALVVGAIAVGQPPVASASSHREAPFVTKNPKTDGTDLYMFNSYDPNRVTACAAGATGCYVTFIADYQPFQDSWGGPNYFNMDPDALYEIMIDNTGDGVEDITFQFQFSLALANSGKGLAIPASGFTGGTPPTGGVAVPFVNLGQVDGTGGMANQNVLESYSINMVTGPRRTGKVQAVTNSTGGSATFAKPMDNIGTKSFADYQTYANGFVFGINIPGCSTAGQVFVGQRAEPFAVNIGPVFDLIDAPKTVITNMADRAVVPNPLQCKNISTIAIEVPTSCLGVATTGPSKDVIGAWTTASVRQARVINPAGGYTTPSVEGGPWAQVSRLGMPLVNELVVGIPDKDAFNTSEPSGDAKTNIGTYAEYPTLPAIIDILFAVPAPATPRTDLLAVFATGVTGVNANGAVAEYQRLNTAIPATLSGTQNSLGAAGCFVDGALTLSATGCDPAGFPNGRRPGDDVVDITLTVAEGYLIPGNTNGFVGDAVIQQASQFGTTFPYLTTPNGGADATGQTPACTGVP
jgi:uncharacterized protein DUF4331